MRQTASVNGRLDNHLPWVLVEGFPEDSNQLFWSSHIQTVYHHRSAHSMRGWGLGLWCSLVYGVHWLSVLVLRIRDAETGGGPFAFCVLDGRQLLIYKKCKSTFPFLLWGYGEDHDVLMPGSEILLNKGWLTGPKSWAPEVQLSVYMSWRGVSMHLRRLSSWCSASQFLYIGLSFFF